jgi:altronate dehydratase
VKKMNKISNEKKAIKLDRLDNVATVMEDVKKGDKITIKGQKPERYVICYSAIPRGHKIALMSIRKGDNIIKYGEVIGIAISNIIRGEHVHIHNLDSIRGKIKEADL